MGKDNHHLPLMPYFLALLALTAGEVGLYEIWRATQFVPKYAIVLIILILTLPKAAIVMIYFMHLKYEKQLLVFLALAPLITVFIAVLTVLVDIKTLKPDTINQQQQITGFGSDQPLDHGKSESGGHK